MSDKKVSLLMKSLFGIEKAVIGMVHFLPLPGTPLYDERGGMERIYEMALRDTKFLQEGGVDAILFCNEGDMPYSTSIPMEIVAAVSSLVAKIATTIKIPYGINMLLDSTASIAVAKATGATFIRTFLTNAYVGDIGFMVTKGAEALRLRRNIYATDVKIIANITAGFAAPLVNRDIKDLAKGAVFIGLADLLCVSGPAAGVETDIELIKKTKEAAPFTPVIVGTGVNEENVVEMLKYSDGVIVGTSLKEDDQTLNPIDPIKVKRFMEAVNKAR
ncbi:MAG: BtpA/SgcQ family protein [Deltaproteobacteria bacterium]|nr:BtpA/SgcQ family protein [Deltaproteobacteria bacterium]